MDLHFRDEKTALGVETFHSQTENGIRQELFAILILAVIARTSSVLMADDGHPAGAEPQFKNAVLTLAQEVYLLTPQLPEQAFVIYTELLHAIGRVRYYRPKTPLPSNPGVSKKPPNRWRLDKSKQTEKA
ncbi:MAG: hypothetical protein ACRERU_21310 [Methylococcales bacterium]